MKFGNARFARTLIAGSSVIALSVHPAFAQEEASDRGGALDEIFVTAQKKVESAQDVGISLTAFSGDSIREFGFDQSSDIVAQTPSLNITASGGEGGLMTFNLRGVGQSDFAEHQEGPVATYIDQAYVGALSGASFSLYDLERVEVLRGPQGTLFGRNATGGLVHFITTKPGRDYEGYFSLEGGSYASLRAETALNAPLGETLSARFSGVYQRNNGYIINRIGRDGSNAESYSGRLQLLWEPTDKASSLLKVEASNRDGVEPRGEWRATAPVAADGSGVFIGHDDTFWSDLLGTPTCPGCDAFGYADKDGDAYKGDFDFNGSLSNNSFSTTLTNEFDFDSFVLTTVTDYRETEKKYTEDSDFSPNDALRAAQNSDVAQFSQEIRLSGDTEKFDWILGGYYLHIDTDIDASLTVGEPLSILAGVGPEFRIGNIGETRTQSFAGFGQVEYKLTDTVSVIGGLRYTTDRKRQVYQTDIPVLLGPYLLNDFSEATVGDAATVRLGKNLSWKGQLNWKPANDLLFYAFVSRGVKAPGFNLVLDGAIDAGGLPLDQFSFREEVLTDYSAGFKSTLFDGRATFNAEGFYYDYKDFQAFALTGLTSLVFNTDAEIYGVDGDIHAEIFDGLTVGLGVAYLNTTAEGVMAPDGSISDRELPLSPKFSMNGLARYAWPLAGGEASLQVDFNHASSQYFEINNNAISHEPEKTIVNLRAGFASPDEHWKAALFVKNVTGQEYRIYAFDLAGYGGLSQNWLGQPRWYGGSISYNF